MISIDNYDFKGKRAIIRVDFNVPLNEKGEVTDDTRIRAAIPTIKKVLAEGGSVILMSHMGRPKKNPDPKFSLEQIVPAIEKRLGVKVMFAGDCMGEKAAEIFAAAVGCDAPAVGAAVEFGFGGRAMRFYRMPSSSRAYPLSVERKAAVYEGMLRAEGILR